MSMQSSGEAFAKRKPWMMGYLEVGWAHSNFSVDISLHTLAVVFRLLTLSYSILIPASVTHST